MGLLDAIQSGFARRAWIDRSLSYGRPVVREFLVRTRKDAGAQRGAEYGGATGVIVDLGAGHGDDLAIAGEVWAGAALHAVEAMAFHAEILEGRGCVVHRLDIERETLPFADGSVDVVIANQVLEHAKELFWILHESARVLRVGGVMIVGVPNLASLHNRLLLLLGRQPTAIMVDSAHVRGFTRHGFRRLLSSAAPGVLRIERCRGANFYPLPAWLARPAARLMPGLAVSAFFLVRKVGSYRREILDYVERSRFETNYHVGPTPKAMSRMDAMVEDRPWAGADVR